jgi:hypothetical protein
MLEISQFLMGVVTGAGVVAMGESSLLDQQGLARNLKIYMDLPKGLVGR